MNNLKQIGVSLIMYVQDYNDYLPPLNTAMSWNGFYLFWLGDWGPLGRLYAGGYVKDVGVFICPSLWAIRKDIFQKNG